jgi:hypothetical protein
MCDGRSPGSEPFNPAFPALPVAFEAASFITVAGAAPVFRQLPVSPLSKGTVGFDIALPKDNDNRQSGGKSRRRIRRRII